MPRILVGSVQDISPEQPVFVRDGEIEVGVFRLGTEFRAYRNRCPHQQGPACHGVVTGTLVATAGSNWIPEWVLDGQVLLCPWHSMEFDLTTGVRIRGRGERLRAYPVHVIDDQVYVDIGAPGSVVERNAVKAKP